MRSIGRYYLISLYAVLALCILAGCAGSTQAPVVSAAAAWPMEGYSPARSRDTDEEVRLPLVEAHEYPLAGVTEQASPVSIADGLLFAEGDQKLHALALADGAEKWQINLAGSYLSPAVAADAVFVRAEAGEDGYVVALQADSGKKLWQYQFDHVGSSYDNIGGHVTSPVVVDGLVLVGAGEAFYALDAADGHVVWRFATEYPVISSAAVADGMLYFGDFVRLYAVDLKQGTERWRYDHGKLSLYFAPILFGNDVALASYDTIIVLNRTSGAKQWSKRFADMQVIPAGATNSHLYVKATNQLWALNAKDGSTAWNYATTAFISLPAITSDQIFVVTRSDGGSQIRALAQSDGREIWRHEQAGLLNAAPVVVGGRVYLRGNAGAILVFAPS